MLDKEKINMNDYIYSEPLSEDNLEKTLNLVNKIRLSFGDTKTIWIYTGYEWSYLQAITNNPFFYDEKIKKAIEISNKRKQIISKCDVLVDGKYIDTQRDITLKWRGSSNQHVIDIQQSLQKGEMILWSE